MESNRPWLPFALSVLIHVAVLFGPGWTVPEAALAPPLIAARLVAARTEAAPPRQLTASAPARVAKGARGSAAKPSASAAEASLPATSDEQVEPDQGGAGEGAAPSPRSRAGDDPKAEWPSEPAEDEGKPLSRVDTTNWPHRGEIRFALLLGRFEVGKAAHAWRHDGERYEIRSQMETTGIAAIGRDVKVAESSTGAITVAGLQPTEYRLERLGKPVERVQFDREGGLLRQEGSAGARERELAGDSQDLLSLYYQIGFLAASSSEMRMSIASARHYGSLAIQRLGEEQAETRLGPLRLLHIRTELPSRDQSVEVWLAVDYRSVPVRIRFVDHKGDAYELQAVSVELDGARLAQPPRPSGFTVN